MKFVWSMSAFSVFCAVVVASAQDWYRYGNPWGYGSGYHHASTVEEGAARGLADVIRSAGAANLMNSEAAKNFEQARRMYMDNRVYGTQKYFEMRSINRQARAAERGPRPSQQDLIRYSEARKPKRLSTSDLDPLTGVIGWPVILRMDEYKTDREQLDAIYAQRAISGYTDGPQMMAIQKLTQDLHSRLRSNLEKYPSQAYMEAKNFLDSLAYESLFEAS